MEDKVKAIIISRDETLVRDLEEKLVTMADIQAMVRDVRGSYSQIKEQAPRLLFLDIRDDAESVFGLAGRVERFLPDTRILVLNDSKDPDLIIRSLKTGAADFILLPVDKNSFLASVKLALEKGARGEREGEIIVISSTKGGQGVTTLAVNLADHIHALTGGRVLLVDFKLQTGDVASFLDLESNYTVVDLLKDMPRLDENLLFSSLTQHSGGFYALTAPEEMDRAEMGDTEDIGRMFRTLKEYMDYIIVDIPHEFTEHTAPVIDIAERILLVSQQIVPALKAVRKALDLFRTVGYEEDRVKIVINRYEKRNEIGQEEMEKLFEQKLFAIVSNDYNAVTDAINKGELLSANHEGSLANRDIAAIATLLTGIQPKGHDQTRQGVFRRLLSVAHRVAEKGNQK
ncbi:MAG: AAA family ATPase [Syntrophobacterales bacterium]|nr:AAA family ATPase [Syntrophobacterales bacterium]